MTRPPNPHEPGTILYQVEEAGRAFNDLVRLILRKLHLLKS